MTRPGPLSVLPVRDRSELRRFLDVEWQVRRDEPGWAPPALRSDLAARLRLRRNPVWRRAEGALFLARRGARLVGRLAVLADALERRPEAAFAFFECAPGDVGAARALFEAAAAVAAEEGATRLVGPSSFPAFPEEAGLPVGDRDEAVLEEAGLAPVAEVAWGGASLGEAPPPPVEAAAGSLPAVKDVAAVVRSAAPGLVGALGWAVTEAEATAKLARLRPLLDPALAAADADGRVAVAVPDMAPLRRAVAGGAGPLAAARLAAAIRHRRAGAVVAFLSHDGPLDVLAAHAAAAGYGRLEGPGVAGDPAPPRRLWERPL